MPDQQTCGNCEHRGWALNGIGHGWLICTVKLPMWAEIGRGNTVDPAEDATKCITWTAEKEARDA